MKNKTVEKLIKTLGLLSHPEGGYYREISRARGIIPKSVLPEGFKGDRNFSTSIYFLLPKGVKSNLHRIASDEQWHFYLGGPITIAEISPGGQLKKTILGPNIHGGQRLQHVVPASCWFGAYPNPKTEFALVGCTVAPGFDFADFELGKKEELLRLFPAARKIILKLT